MEKVGIVWLLLTWTTIICGKCCHNPRIWFKVLLEMSWVTASSFLAGPVVESQQKKFWDQITTFSSSSHFETIFAVLYVSRKILLGFIDTCHSLWPPIDIIATRPHFSVCTHLLGKDNDHWSLRKLLQNNWAGYLWIGEVIKRTSYKDNFDYISSWSPKFLDLDGWLPKLDGKGARQERNQK